MTIGNTVVWMLWGVGCMNPKEETSDTTEEVSDTSIDTSTDSGLTSSDEDCTNGVDDDLDGEIDCDDSDCASEPSFHSLLRQMTIPITNALQVKVIQLYQPPFHYLAVTVRMRTPCTLKASMKSALYQKTPVPSLKMGRRFYVKGIWWCAVHSGCNRLLLLNKPF